MYIKSPLSGAEFSNLYYFRIFPQLYSESENLKKKNVIGLFTGSDDVRISSALKIGDIIIMTANVSNVKSGWTKFPLKFDANIVSTMLCIVHRNSINDVNLLATGSFDGSTLNILSSANVVNDLQINLIMVIK